MRLFYHRVREKQRKNNIIDYSIINFIYGLIVHIQIYLLIIIRIIIIYFCVVVLNILLNCPKNKREFADPLRQSDHETSVQCSNKRQFKRRTFTIHKKKIGFISQSSHIAGNYEICKFSVFSLYELNAFQMAHFFLSLILYI